MSQKLPVVKGYSPTDKQPNVQQRPPDRRVTRKQPDHLHDVGKMVKRRGRPVADGLRWTISLASREFGRDDKTISDRLRRNNMEPGADGLFSTLQILNGVFGSVELEKFAKLQTEHEILKEELASIRRTVLPTEDVLRVWGDVIVAIRQIVKGSSLSDAEKNETLRQIRELNVNDFVKEKAEL
jgi:hypothetical protein